MELYDFPQAPQYKLTTLIRYESEVVETLFGVGRDESVGPHRQPQRTRLAVATVRLRRTAGDTQFTTRWRPCLLPLLRQRIAPEQAWRRTQD